MSAEANALVSRSAWQSVKPAPAQERRTQTPRQPETEEIPPHGNTNTNPTTGSSRHRPNHSGRGGCSTERPVRGSVRDKGTTREHTNVNVTVAVGGHRWTRRSAERSTNGDSTPICNGNMKINQHALRPMDEECQGQINGTKEAERVSMTTPEPYTYDLLLTNRF